jgi:hypothetical protein
VEPLAPDFEARAYAALRLAFEYGSIDGSHHKQWIIDQMVRALKGPGYEAWVEHFEDGEDGPGTYSWDEGIAPYYRSTEFDTPPKGGAR